MSAFAAQILVRLDADAPESLQAQLCAALRRAIRAGVLRPGTRLPSSRALAADLRISRTTAVLAYDQLLAEGVLATRAGSGTFVAVHPWRARIAASVVRTAERGASRPVAARRGHGLDADHRLEARRRAAALPPGHRRRSTCCRCTPGRGSRRGA